MPGEDLQDEDDHAGEAPQSAARRLPTEINFWPRHSTGFESMQDRAIRGRTALLFDPSIDAAQHLLDPVSRSPATEAFKIFPSEFIRRARRLAPREPQATASAFSQWIYSLYGKAHGDEEDRERGKEMEAEIYSRRRQAYCSVSNAYLQSVNSDWRLVHNGLHVQGRIRSSCFHIRQLAVGGCSLKASPDLMYQDRRTSEVVIVEIKYSQLPITANLWPNVWGQLWCYSKVEPALRARKVTVIGEVWGHWWLPRRRRRRWYDPGQPIVCLRASVRRDPRASAYDRFFRKLFDIYRGG